MARIVFMMPRCRHDNIRGVHKQAYSLTREGHEILLVVKESDVSEYMGMQVITANAAFENIFRSVLNLSGLFRQARQLKGDVYVLQNPDTILLAITLRCAGQKVIYDTHEDFSKRPMIYPLLPKWVRPIAAWVITRLERLLAHFASAVVVTQAQQLEDFYGQTILLPNAPLTEGPIIETAHATDVGEKENEPTFIYVGGITRKRGILSMLDLVVRMNRQCACRLTLVGWFRSEKLKRRAMQHPGWSFVDYRGRVSHAETLAHIMRSDIGLAILDPVADYPTSSITKLFEYMQFGIPCIASNFPAWNVSTKSGPPGFYVDPLSPDEIEAAALRLLEDPALRERMGRAGKHYIETEFSWERVSVPFLDLVAGLTADGKRPSCNE